MRIHRNTVFGATVIEQGGVYWLSIRDCFSISPQSPDHARHGSKGRWNGISMDIPFTTKERAVACLQLMDKDPRIATKLMSELAPELKQNGWIDSVGIVKRRKLQDHHYRIAEPAGKA
jgi:hypothetical protein